MTKRDTPCPVCGNKYTERGVKTHVTRKHPQYRWDAEKEAKDQPKMKRIRSDPVNMEDSQEITKKTAGWTTEEKAKDKTLWQRVTEWWDGLRA